MTPSPARPFAPRTWLVPIMVTSVAALAALLVAPLPSPWAAWRPATCFPAACFCEGLRDQLIRQPANTISSLLFLIPAVALLRRPGPDRAGLAVYGSALAVIGLGSAWYHASLTFVGQTFDVLGMYLVGTFAVLAGIRRRTAIRPSRAVGGYVAANAALLWLLILLPAGRRYAFGALVLAAIVLNRGTIDAAGRSRLARALGLFGVGLAAWGLDLARIGCHPNAWFQGHALWHALTAAAAWVFYPLTVVPEENP